MVELRDRIAPAHTAILVIDVQNDFVDPAGKVAKDGSDVAIYPPVIAAINDLVVAGREAGALIMYARVEHGPEVDLPPYRAKYESRGMYETDTLCHAGSWGAQLSEAVVPPLPSERLFIKHGYDVFQVPEVEPMLRDAGIETVVVCGVVTNLCVAAAVFSAFERGFFVVVPRETTAGTNEPAVDDMLKTIARYYGDVVPLADVLEGWRVDGRASTLPAA